MTIIICQSEVHPNCTVLAFKDFTTGLSASFAWSTERDDTLRYEEFKSYFIQPHTNILGDVSRAFLTSPAKSALDWFTAATAQGVAVFYDFFPEQHIPTLEEYLKRFLGIWGLKKGIGLDIETRSLCDLKVRGLHNYAADPSTRLLCCCWGPHGDRPDLWVPGDHEAVERLNHLARDPEVFFTAWNAQFEIENWKRQHHKHGFLPLPEERWVCTQGIAASRALPLGLGKCAEALRMPFDKRKDSAGTRLINKLCKPLKGTTEFAQDPVLLSQLNEYCRQDVVTESGIFLHLGYEHDAMEDLIQRLTWGINRDGVPVDIPSTAGVISRYVEFAKSTDEETEDFTDGRVKSPRQLAAFLEEFDNPPPNLQKETMRELLAGDTLTERDRKLLNLRIAASSASTAKYKKILSSVAEDATVKGTLQYRAAATGRDGGRGLQPQNLPGGTPEDPDAEIHALLNDSLGPDFNKRVSALTRAMIKAPPGYKFIDSDYGQIEARGVPWLCQEEEVLASIRAGVEPYIAAAAVMFDCSAEEVTEDQRKLGKVVVLACGYQGGWSSVARVAGWYGLEFSREEAVKHVEHFKATRRKLVEGWENFGKAAMTAIRHPGNEVQVPHCLTAVFYFNGTDLSMRLPSGRLCWFPFASIGPQTINYPDKNDGTWKSFETTGINCMRQNEKSQWVQTSMSGGKFLQNWVQATCRDVLMWRTPELEKRGYHVIIRVHDEVLTLVPDTPKYNLTELNNILTVNPPWAEGLPLGAGGYESYRFRK